MQPTTCKGTTESGTCDRIFVDPHHGAVKMSEVGSAAADAEADFVPSTAVDAKAGRKRRRHALHCRGCKRRLQQSKRCPPQPWMQTRRDTARPQEVGVAEPCPTAGARATQMERCEKACGSTSGSSESSIGFACSDTRQRDYDWARWALVPTLSHRSGQ